NQASYALMDDSRVMAWGNGADGRLGNGGNVASLTPVYVRTSNSPITYLDNVIQLGGMENAAAALRADGTVWTWGDNGKQERGSGSTAGNLAMQVTGLPPIVKIATGDFNVLALDENGHLWTWGSNDERNLGDGVGGPSQAVPRRIIAVGETAPTTNYLTGIIDMAAGQWFSMALLADGRVVSWGSNRESSVGHGVATHVARYVEVTGGGQLNNIAFIGAGDGHGLAMTREGDLYTWGWNGNGQLGLGNTTNYPRATPVTTVPFKAQFPCPVANLGPNVVLCNPISAELYAGTLGPSFKYEWYKDGVLLSNEDDNYALQAFLWINSPGTYRVVITDTAAFTVCNNCPVVEDEVVVSTSAVAPINNNFCAPPSKQVNLRVDDPGSYFNWYAAPTGGTALATGTNSFTTPLISETTTYYVEDTRSYSYTTGYNANGGDGLGSLASAWNNSASGYMQFTVEQQITLASVNVRGAGGCTGSLNRTINLTTTGGAILQSSTQPMACATNTITTFPLGFTINPGTYRLAFTASHNVQYFDAGAAYPRGITGIISLTGTGKWDNSSSSFFFDWVIEAPSSCGRIPVQAILTTECPAPVEFVSFTGKKVNEDNHLFWSTASEKNSAYFEVQRSYDGNSFTSIGKIKSTGNSSRLINYHFVDKHADAFHPVSYYRLRQVDLDDTYEFSPIIALENSGHQLSLTAYPNPVAGGTKLNIRALSVTDSDIRLTMHDLQGRTVFTDTYDLHVGVNEYEINTYGLAKGIYLLKAHAGDDAPQVIKLIIE
ncbi:MAG: T9SS type A sorting domain-containing protein, partial [Cytophagaceae bacterium]